MNIDSCCVSLIFNPAEPTYHGVQYYTVQPAPVEASSAPLEASSAPVEDSPEQTESTSVAAAIPVINPPPVVHGVQYYTVPTTDMVYVAADEQAREWYVVTRGIFVGVFKYS